MEALQPYCMLCCHRLSMDTNPKLTAQVSSIVGKVIRECLMAFARTSTDGDSSKQQAGGYLCRDLGGDMKYMLAFCNPRVRAIATLAYSVC